jgi:undecaprenyl-diphosphatase
MSYIDAVILGILQGLTEFLPVSSSGHLVLGEALLGIKEPGVTFEVLLHVGTLLSVFVYFRARIITLVRAVFDRGMVEERRVILMLIVATIPAGVVGILFKDFFERAFSNPVMTSVLLAVTGVILLLTRIIHTRKGNLGFPASIWMGIGQALAIFPGISRSGSTIAAGMLAGVKPDQAAEFSFLMVIPAIGGATLLQGFEISEMDAARLVPMILGTICAFIMGLVAVYVVLSVVRRGRFDWFAYYCFAASAVGLYLFL